MSLTRKLLKELELNEEAIERIIAAHVDTVDALKQETQEARSAAELQQAQALAVQEELTAYREQVEQEQHASARRCALAEALTSQGANAAALPLLLETVALPEEAWNGDTLTDPAAILTPIRAKYAGLFAARKPIPITRVSPPLNGGGQLTHADVKRMSAHDINRNWSAVKSALEG